MEGGYEVSGVWPFASGCLHCTWLFGIAHVYDGNTTSDWTVSSSRTSASPTR